MTKALHLLLVSSMLIAKSSDATLTVYKDGTALVKQPVAWTIPAGKSYVTWSGLPNGVHKDTPFLNLDGADILSQRFNDNIFSGADYFSSLRGEQIQVKPKDGKLVKGTLLEINSSSVTIAHQSGVISFNRGELEYIGNKNKDLLEPFFHPYLSWNIKSSKTGRLKGDLVYKLSNISWETIYRLIINGQIKGELVADAVIFNNSSKDYINTNIQLVEGKLNNVKPKISHSPKDNNAVSRYSVSKMEPASLGDYHIYNVENKIKKLIARESITVRMYGPLNVDYEKIYVFENSERQQKEEPLKVEITLSNTEATGLGIPLPAGKIDMYTFTGSGGIEYIGSDQMGQVPKGESSTIQAGYAFDITGKRKVLNYSRQRKSEEAVIEISVNNTRSDPVQIKIVEHINGDWVIKDQSHDYKKEDASTIHFAINLEPGKKEYITYTYKKEWK